MSALAFTVALLLAFASGFACGWMARTDWPPRDDFERSLVHTNPPPSTRAPFNVEPPEPWPDPPRTGRVWTFGDDYSPC